MQIENRVTRAEQIIGKFVFPICTFHNNNFGVFSRIIENIL